MEILELLVGLFDLFLLLVAAPRAIYRLYRRLARPTEEQIAASNTSEMGRFRRNVWLVFLGWLALSIGTAWAFDSPWGGVIAFAIGLLLLPGIIESRYDRLLAKLRPPA
ncbi:MAG: hypothetical protein NTV97_23875 [Alphaproteobacteria bacterium]|nr:hypothetical protein [Alphaproteobacteria bacterium]